MRRTGRGSAKWVYNAGGDLVGIAMGSDFCSEHEWGVKGMKAMFATNDSKDGIERRRIHQIPKDLRFIEGKDFDALFLSPLESHYKQPADWMKTELAKRSDEVLSCAWDEKSFGVVAYGEKDRKNLKVLFEAFNQKDIAFWPNVGIFHMGGGLIFCIVSKVPDADKKVMLEGDLDTKAMLKAAKATGIEEELEKAELRSFALSPKWAKQISDVKTKHPVVFWLNPFEQDRYNSGYMTVEDLQQWIKGEGPVMKQRGKKR